MAVGEYTRAIGVNPNYTDAYFKRGYSYEKLDQDQNAISDYDKAITRGFFGDSSVSSSLEWGLGGWCHLVTG
jgi:hypothetical protein